MSKPAGVRPGDVVAMPIRGGGYGACQVTAVSRGFAVVCGIDWFSGHVPTLDELAAAGSFRPTHGMQNGMILYARVRIDLLPSDWVRLGRQPTRPGVPTTSNTGAEWTYFSWHVQLQRHWDTRVGEPMKTAYKAAADNAAVEVDFGAGPVPFRTFPPLPPLHCLSIDGLRSTAAKVLRERHRGTGMRLYLSGAKSDAWLAVNFTNPFGDWVDDSVRFGNAACRAYTRASTAIDAIDPAAGDAPARAEQALRGLVADLNTIDAKYQMIDTLRRGEAGDAFFELAARAGIPDEVAAPWFDEREF